jgi:hypothetical protein
MDYWEKQNSRKMAPHWGAWITDLINQPGEAYFYTLMFHNVPGKLSTKIDLMLKDVETVYYRMLTRAVKNPRSELHGHKRPLLLASPDLPVLKNNKDGIETITINDGAHIHAIVIARPGHVFTQPLQYHMIENKEVYLVHTCIRYIHVIPITKTPAVVSQYALKAIGIHFDESRILLLPGPRPTKKRQKLIDCYI